MLIFGLCSHMGCAYIWVVLTFGLSSHMGSVRVVAAGAKTTYHSFPLAKAPQLNAHLPRGRKPPMLEKQRQMLLHHFLFFLDVAPLHHQPSRYLSTIRSVLTAADAIPCTLALNRRGNGATFQTHNAMQFCQYLDPGCQGGPEREGLLRCRKICATLYSLTAPVTL